MNLVKLDPQAQSYEFVLGKRKTTLSYDAERLRIREEGTLFLGESSFLLEHLSPGVTESFSNDPEAFKGVRESWLYFLGAVIVYFSDFNASIPLLAPGLLLVWALKFGSNASAAYPRKWVSIDSVLGRPIVRIPAPSKPEEVMDKARLNAFISGLSKAVENTSSSPSAK